MISSAIAKQNDAILIVTRIDQMKAHGGIAGILPPSQGSVRIQLLHSKTSPTKHPMKTIPKILATLAICATAGTAGAQLIVNDYSAKVISFSSNVTGVWSVGGGNPTGSLAGPTPSGSIPYDSDAWALRAGTAQDLTLPPALSGNGSAVGFGGTSAAGAISRGVESTAGWGTSGLGVVTGVTSGPNFGNAIGFRPQGGSTDNAAIFLRVQNTTGSTVTSWKLDYNLYYINIGVATSGAFAYSTDGGASFSSNVSALGFTTLGTNTVTTPTVSDWTLISLAETTISASVANNDYLILRWALGNDVASGNMNRLAIDDISVTAVPEPTTWALLAGSLTTLVIFRRRRRN